MCHKAKHQEQQLQFTEPAMHALQGIGPSIERLASGKLCTPEALPASLASLLKPIVQSGMLWHVCHTFRASCSFVCYLYVFVQLHPCEPEAYNVLGTMIWCKGGDVHPYTV